MAEVSGEDGAIQPAGEGAGEYCRQVEAYLCRKNDGHLIRIAGPSFARVCDWADRGMPLSVVFRGIDRYFERYYSRGPRRRPVHIDFCEHDVLDVFDEWRRAVGVRNANEESREQPGRSRSRTASLPAHLERVIVRLTTLRAGGRLAPRADDAVANAIRELDAVRATAAHLRGEARAVLVNRLRDVDAQLVTVLRESIGADERRMIEREARGELAPFRGGMADEEHERAVATSATRLLRERTGLPIVAYEEQ